MSVPLGAITGNDPTRIDIARQFARFLGGRYRSDGPHSGEEFRDDYLVPALENARRIQKPLTVDFDGVSGFPASFLEEAFGGLVRERGFSADELGRILIVKSSPLFESYRSLVLRYIREARPRIPN